MNEATHIRFEMMPTPVDKKTKTWAVIAKADGFVLGQVRWFARWYQYSFYPNSDTVYERTCLRDIAAFCEVETTKHRSTWGKKPEGWACKVKGPKPENLEDHPGAGFASL